MPKDDFTSLYGKMFQFTLLFVGCVIMIKGQTTTGKMLITNVQLFLFNLQVTDIIIVKKRNYN